MGRKMKLDPLKHCKACGAVLRRKRMPSGQIEDMGSFLRRLYCNQACMAKGMEGMKVVSPQNSRKQSRKSCRGQCEQCGRPRQSGRLYVHHIDENPLNNEPSNLKTLCGSCHRLEHTRKSKGTPLPLRLCAYCTSPARKRGMCQKHYQRWKKHGDPFLIQFGGNSGGRIARAAS